jgi:hypothetical protein
MNLVRHSSSLNACKSYHPISTPVCEYSNFCKCSNGSGGFFGDAIRTTSTCTLGHNTTTLTCNTVLPTCPYGTFNATSNTCPPLPTCEHGTYDTTTQSCPPAPPPDDPCAAGQGQPTSFKKTYSSAAAYDSAPIYETTSQGGCGVTVGSMQCGTSPTGEFACWGTGTYTGATVDPVEVGGVDDNPTNESPPEPLNTSTSGPTCTPPTTTGSTTSYSCVTESSASEFAGSSCAMGTYNGTTGMICTKPAYVPESIDKTRTDEVVATSNPDGSTTTTTTSTTDTTFCSGGNCKDESTTTTTTTTTGPDGEVLSKEETCTGPDCEQPEDPEKERKPSPFKTPEVGDIFATDTEDTPSYSDTMNNFQQRVEGSPIVSSLGGLTVPSVSSASFGSVSLFGGSISFDAGIQSASNILGPLRYLFLAIWAWAAIRLFMSA